MNSVRLIYYLIKKDLTAKGWDELSIAEAMAECQRERLATGADERIICVKEMSYLSQESLQIVAKRLEKKGCKERLKPIFSKVCTGFKFLMPYMSLIAVVLCLLNFLFLVKIQSDIEDIQYRMDNINHSVRNISTHYDNSDVIRAIEAAEKSINGSIDIYGISIEENIDEAEKNIRSEIMIRNH